MTASNYIAELVTALWDAFVAMRYWLAIMAVCVGSCMVIGHLIQIATEAMT